MPSNVESIAGFAGQRGAAESCRISADAPLRLDAYAGAFEVAKGYVDLFAVPLRQGESAGARRHVMRIAAGGLVCGLPASDAAAVIAVGGLESEIRHLQTPEALAVSARNGESLLDGWIAMLAEHAFGAVPAWPEALAETTADTHYAASTRLYAPRGVLWVWMLEGSLDVMDGPERIEAGEPLCAPLVAGLWLRGDAPARYAASPTSALPIDRLADSLALFHRLAMRALTARLAEHDRISHRRLLSREAMNDKTMARAVTRLAGIGHAVADRPEELAGADPLVFAFATLARRMGAALPPLPRSVSVGASLPQLARLTGFGFRRVLLRENWWRTENGPLIAYRKSDQVAVALLPKGHKRYTLIDGEAEIPVTARIAADLDSEAVMLYPPPAQKAESLRGIVGLALHGSRGDLGMVLLMGVLATALATALPIGTGYLFESVVPRAEIGQLAAVITGLVIAALGAACFEFVKGIALVRLEARMESVLQPLVMQRLLSLPVGFFRNFGTGDLTDRVLAIQRIRHLITGTAIVSLLATGFAVINLAVILLYSPILALLSLGVVGLAALVTAGLGIAQLSHERDAVRLGGREDGLILQFVQGIPKLRVSASESRMFGLWAEVFSQRRSALVRGQRYANLRATFYGSYPIIAALLLFQVASSAIGVPDGLSLGGFLAVSAAFGQLLAAMMAGGGALAGTLGAVPLFERLQPLLTAKPERGGDQADPGPLTGAIEISNVSFRYGPDAPLVLEDVSLRIEPGQFVAIVGSSGSGKSTLQRLLLGFETAEAGDILYQGQSIGALDAPALRRRIGVVLQNARIMSGSIFENITASLSYSLEDAWEAARMAGIAADIEAMPMGMHSVLMEGASTLSGGQLQRVLIARALVGRPQVLIFDEATSALDNVSQHVVTESLNRLHATRIIIAHRLSTIRDADRIFVLERGRLVESGTYDSLMAQDGAFAQLAHRQLL